MRVFHVRTRSPPFASLIDAADTIRYKCRAPSFTRYRLSRQRMRRGPPSLPPATRLLLNYPATISRRGSLQSPGEGHYNLPARVAAAGAAQAVSNWHQNRALAAAPGGRNRTSAVFVFPQEPDEQPQEKNRHQGGGTGVPPRRLPRCPVEQLPRRPATEPPPQ